MNVQVIEPIQLRGFAQPSCNFRGGFEGVDGSVGLNSECGQAVNSGIRSHIEDDLGPLRRGLPTSEDIFFQEICTEKIELPLQHFAQITSHLQSIVRQVRQP